MAKPKNQFMLFVAFLFGILFVFASYAMTLYYFSLVIQTGGV